MPPPPSKGTCPADGNCTKSPSCCGNGLVCYQKDQYWASCRPQGQCAPGIHLDDPKQYQTPWSCKAIGGNVATTGTPFNLHWKLDSERVVDVAASLNQNGNKVHMWDPNGTAAQKFVKTACGQIKWADTNKCLDVKGGGDFNGNMLQIWDCSCNNKNQKFEATSFGGLKWTGSNKCIDVAGGGRDKGTLLHMWDCMPENINQMFEVRTIASGLTISSMDFTSEVLSSDDSSLAFPDSPSDAAPSSSNIGGDAVQLSMTTVAIISVGGVAGLLAVAGVSYFLIKRSKVSAPAVDATASPSFV